MRHASHFRQAARRVPEEGIVASIGVRWNVTPISLEKLLRSGALPRCRVVKQHYWMIRVATIGPHTACPRERQLLVQHFHAGVIGADHLRREQNLFRRRVQRLQQPGALRHPAAHRFTRDLYAVTCPDLLLPVQREMIGALGYDHLSQQTRPCGALLNRLRRLGCCAHCAGASVLLAHVLDHCQLRGNVFVALARFLADQP